MAHIVLTRETKSSLLARARGGDGIDAWLFQFIRHEPEFQAELFRVAEVAQNWHFLTGLSGFRAADRAAQAKSTPSAPAQPPPPSLPKPAPKVPVTPPLNPRARDRRKHQFHPKKARPPQPPPPAYDPRKLPAHMVIQVRSSDFTHCPRCNLRILKRVLRDHLELACPQRGKVDGVVAALRSSARGCIVCGGPTIAGEDYCLACLGD